MTTTKITTKHTAALARHLADALGDATTDRAELVIAGIGLDDHATYDDLAGVTHAVASDGLAAAGVTVLPLRRGAVTALFGLVRPGAPTCNACGRLALRLTGSTWQPVTAATCPVDAGLYVAAQVMTVRGWHDGREYPEGTTHDDEGVPLDSSTIRVERGVSPMVDAALRETEATLLDVLAAVVAGGATPAEALTAVSEPLRRWPSAIALRAFVRDAKGALTLRTGGATPPPFAGGGEVPSGPVDLRALREALVSLYDGAANIRRVARDAGVSLARIDASGSAETAWFSVVEEAAKTGHVGALLAVALREYPSDAALRALTVPSADRDAVYSALVRLLPAQFEAAVFRLSVPPHVLPGAHASMAERAVALLRIAEQRGQLAQLAAIARAP